MPGQFSVDFSQVADREAVPAGDYVLEVASCDLAVSQGQKSAGTQMLKLRLKVVGGEHDGSSVWENLLLGGDSMWKTKQFFVALFGKGQAQITMDVEELVGSQCRGKVTQEVWAVEQGGDGEPRNRVARYLPLEVQTARTLDDMFSS